MVAGVLVSGFAGGGGQGTAGVGLEDELPAVGGGEG